MMQRSPASIVPDIRVHALSQKISEFVMSHMDRS